MSIKINDNGVNRDMTAEEEAAYLVWAETAQAKAQAQAEAEQAKAQTKASALEKLGLTANEVKALFG